MTESNRPGDDRPTKQPDHNGEDRVRDDTAAREPTPEPSDHTAAADESSHAEAASELAQPPESAHDAMGPAREAGTEAETGDGGGAGSGGAAGDGRGGRQRARLQLLLVALLIGALGAGGGWLAWRVQRLEQRVATVPEQRQQALQRFARSDALADSMDQLEQKLSSEVERLDRAVDELAQADNDKAQALRKRIDGLEQAVATVRELAGRDQLDWRLAEVHYLVAVAARRLTIAHDRRAAIAAMEAADRSLAAVGDVRLLELRQRLIDDVTTLRQTEPADVEGIALRIQSLLQRLPELPARDARASADAASDEPASGLAGWWQRLRDRLSQYVVVRRQGQGEPGTRPQREAALAAAEKLGYALSEARRAALRREPAPYKAALERARSLLDDGFAAESPTVAHFRERIEKLAQRSVTTDYPDLTKTLDRVERVTAELASRRQRPDFVDSSEED